MRKPHRFCARNFVISDKIHGKMPQLVILAKVSSLIMDLHELLILGDGRLNKVSTYWLRWMTSFSITQELSLLSNPIFGAIYEYCPM
jgi:hypothetical protein